MDTVYCRDTSAWSNWLKSHHDSCREIWLLFPKKHTGKPCVTYGEALDEALCHGWIDSLIKRIDDDWYARKFTPRTNTERWSDVNKRRVAQLIRDRRMMPYGMAKVEYQKATGRNADPKPHIEMPATVPLFIRREFQKNAKAWENFQKLAPSHRRHYIGWIIVAKREETRQKRLKEATRMLAANQKLGLK